MSTFKTKNTKYNSYCQNNNKNLSKSTLDNKHQLKLSEFEKNYNNIHNIENSISILQSKFDDLNNIDPINYTYDMIINKANIKSQIQNLEDKKFHIVNKFDEIDYYYNTIDTIDEYYNTTGTELSKDNSLVQKNIINTTFFNSTELSKDNQIITNTFNDNNDIIKKNNNIQIKDLNDIFLINQNKIKSNNIVINTNNDKSKLYNKYMQVVYNENINDYKNTNSDDYDEICNKCNNRRIINYNECLLICKFCGNTDSILLKTEKSNYKDPLYKRINHLSELLNQFQAKESTDIDEDIYDTIKAELLRQRISNYKTLNHINMRAILKKLKLNKYYEHIQRIINKLNGVPPPTMSRETEEKLKQYFKEIQKPFSLYKPKNRKNFLSYNYIIHKLLELLELDDFLPYFPLLKSRDKLEEQDEIWEKICKYKQWQFIPSI